MDTNCQIKGIEASPISLSLSIVQCDVKDCVMCSEEDVCVKCEDGFKVEGKKCEETPNNVPIIIG